MEGRQEVRLMQDSETWWGCDILPGSFSRDRAMLRPVAGRKSGQG